MPDLIFICTVRERKIPFQLELLFILFHFRTYQCEGEWDMLWWSNRQKFHGELFSSLSSHPRGSIKIIFDYDSSIYIFAKKYMKLQPENWSIQPWIAQWEIFSCIMIIIFIKYVKEVEWKVKENSFFAWMLCNIFARVWRNLRTCFYWMNWYKI